MKIFVTGAGGQLGNDVLNELAKRGHEAVGTDRHHTGYHPIRRTFPAVSGKSPDAVIHCAAWTAVDAAEEAENHDNVYLANAEGTKKHC